MNTAIYKVIRSVKNNEKQRGRRNNTTSDCNYTDNYYGDQRCNCQAK